MLRFVGRVVAADAQWALTLAVYDTLLVDGPLSLFCGESGSPTFNRVFEGRSPREPTFPFVVIGQMDGQADDTKTSDGMDLRVDIHSFSRAHGKQQLRQMMGTILDALDQKSLTLDGFDLVQLTFETSTSFSDPDGLTEHGVQQFRALTVST